MAPDRPKIYHITHVSNLQEIVDHGGLMSDALMIGRGGPKTAIGMSKIKQRRLTQPVPPHAGTAVGDYVPFYFCPRSIMLYVIHCANHPDLAYREGQGSIIHLESDLMDVVDRASCDGQRWAFTSSNAGARYAQFYDDLRDLDNLSWQAIEAHDWRDPSVREGKQAEFLYHGLFPWDLVERIVVRTASVHGMVQAAIASSGHQPRTSINREWYY